MTRKSRPYKHLLFVTLGLASMIVPALAQTAPAKWQPSSERIVITANAAKNMQVYLTGTLFDKGYVVSASLPVPYGDLDLSKSLDLNEFDRRIDVAANLVCLQLDLKYPRALYPVIGEDNCLQSTVNDGMAKKNEVIAAAKR